MVTDKVKYQLKFLESTENLKRILSANSGRAISHRLCNNIMSCLQQGRSFFEIAEVSPLEIKPLIVFYGMMGFARAMIMARTLSNVETLPRTHGLTDISPNTATLETLSLKISSSGTFHLMNDCIKDLEKFIIHSGPDVRYVRQSTASAQELKDRTFTLRDVLARICGLEKDYFDTFHEHAKVIGCSHFGGGQVESHQYYEFQIYTDDTLKSTEDLIRIVSRLRNTFSFLKNWSFKSAGSNAGAFVSIEFTNQRYAGRSPEDNSDVSAITAVDSYGCQAYYDGKPILQDDILSKTAPISGGLSYGRDTHIIEPFEGLFLSESTLYYMGMFLLSSLVRYRPDIWSNALSRRAVSTNPVDDKALSIVEHFIEISLSRFSEFVVSVIKEPS